MNALKWFALALAAAATLLVSGTALGAAPANDEFAAAVELSGSPASHTGTNADAVKEAGEPNHAGNAGGASIWYRWTAPAAGLVTVATCGSDFDTLLAVYTGDTIGTLTSVASNDDTCAEQSRLSFEATAGTTYRIAVDGFDGATGSVDLLLGLPPSNDDFADAELLTGEAGSVAGTTAGASDEDGELAHAGFGTGSVWFAWTAPSTGSANFDTCESDFDTVLAVYTGAELSALTQVAANDDSCDVGSRLSFQATRGATYLVAIAGYEGDGGGFRLAWSTSQLPAASANPVITGLARDGETLSASEGQWVGAQPITLSYAWGRCNASTCDLIPGANSQTYMVASGDVGYRLYVRVTASNAGGSASAQSDTTAVVVARAPANATAPRVTGAMRIGGLLVASPGIWTGTAPISTTYQWQYCQPRRLICSNLAAQTGQVIRLRAGHLGTRLRVVVTATNAGGSAAAVSAPTGVLRRPVPRRCIVPNVRGRTATGAARMIRAAGCRTGRIAGAFSATVRQGRVISQTPRPGARLRYRAKVNFVLSRGRRR
jgi:hypothetical protein